MSTCWVYFNMEVNEFIDGFLLSFLCVFGLFGNSISMIVLLHKEMRSSTSCLLIGLAISDSVFLAVELYQVGIPTVKEYYGIYPFLNFSTSIVDAYVRTYWYFMVNVAQTVSILLTIAITIERYIAVIHPFKAYKYCTIWKAVLAQCVIAPLAVAGSFPDVYAFTFHSQGYGDDMEYYNRRTAYFSSDTYQIFSTLARPIYEYFIPFVIIAILNTKIYLEIRRAQARRAEMTQSLKEQVQLSIMLLTLVLLFGICNLPRIIHYMLFILYHHYGVVSNGMGEVLEFFYTISEVLIVVNSAVNFVIYTTKGAKFRKVLWKMICCEYKCCAWVRRRGRTRLTYRATKSSNRSTTATSL